MIRKCVNWIVSVMEMWKCLTVVWTETYRGEVGQLAKNQVRQAKNIAICVIALASRAAISGGMIPEEAFSMVDGYIMKIEDMNNAVKIDSMMRQAEYEFAEYVAEIHKNQQKNELVERTKNYIYQKSPQ